MWIAVTVVTIDASLWQVIINHHTGLYGETSERMSPVQGACAAMPAITHAWWAAMLALAGAGDRSALRGLIWNTGIWSVVMNGVVALVAAPPPGAAFPYQDLACSASFVSGDWRAYRWFRNLVANRRPVRRMLPLVNLVAGRPVFSAHNQLGASRRARPVVC